MKPVNPGPEVNAPTMAYEALVLLFPHKVITDKEEADLRDLAEKEEMNPNIISGWIGLLTRNINRLRQRVGKVYVILHRDETDKISQISPVSSR